MEGVSIIISLACFTTSTVNLYYVPFLIFQKLKMRLMELFRGINLFEGKDLLEAIPYLKEATDVPMLQVPIEVFEGNEAKDKK